jgi:CRISPR-associated endonuclease/helicase Cas3
MSQFWAHTYNQANQPHLLHDHLREVGKLARQFAADGNPALAEAAEWAGLLHDLGKYRAEFQDYLRDKRKSSHETHHAIYGAALAYNQRKLALAFAIAAHHAGLHDTESLRELLKDARYDFGCLPELQQRFETEVGKLHLDFADPDFCKDKLRLEMFTRMIFSALVDADFLDTECHYQMQTRESFALEPERRLDQLLAEKNSKPTAGALNALRNRIFQQCLDAATLPPGFFSLTVPTGGGKTLSGMAFALKHAQVHRLRRVIVVIPYLSTFLSLSKTPRSTVASLTPKTKA